MGKKIVILLILFTASLAGACVVFRLLGSVAEFKHEEMRLSGAIVGFFLMFFMLVYFTVGLRPGEYDDKSGVISGRDGARVILRFCALMNAGRAFDALQLLHERWSEDAGEVNRKNFLCSAYPTRPGSHQNLSIRLVKCLAESEVYLVAFDVDLRIPRLETLESLRKLPFAGLRRCNKEQIAIVCERLLAELNIFYEIQSSQKKEILKCFAGKSLQELSQLDVANKIATMFNLEPKKNSEISSSAYDPVQVHVRKIVTVLKQGSTWKIRQAYTAQKAIQTMPIPPVV